MAGGSTAVICPPCRDGQHGACPEVARQHDAALPLVILAGSARCACQHQPRAVTASSEKTAGERMAAIRTVTASHHDSG